MTQPTMLVTAPFISTDPSNNPGGVYLDNGSITSNGAGVLTLAGKMTGSAGLSVTASGITVTAGGVSITAGGATVTAGGVSITAGGAAVTGGLVTDTVSGGVASITATIGSTLAVSGLRVILAVPSNAASATNLTLATGLNGQELTVINSNSTGAVTLVITGNVVAATTISGATAAKFIFNTTLASWTKC